MFANILDGISEGKKSNNLNLLSALNEKQEQNCSTYGKKKCAEKQRIVPKLIPESKFYCINRETFDILQ